MLPLPVKRGPVASFIMWGGGGDGMGLRSAREKCENVTKNGRKVKHMEGK